MIERLDYYLPNCGSGLDTGIPMGLGFPPIGGFCPGGYGSNRDALTLKGPLAYDQYGDNKNKSKEKDSGFWKGLLCTGIATAAGILAWRVPSTKAALTKAGTYIVNLAKKFVK